MHFYFISGRMFKKREKKEKTKQKLGKRKKQTIVGALVAVVLALAVVFVYAKCRMPSYAYCEGVGKISLLASSEEERSEFFEQFGYEVREIECKEIIIPAESEEFEEYNELQKSQGLDLEDYCGKKAKMYTVSIENNKQELFGVIIVIRGKVVAAHLTDNLYPACLMALNKG